MLHQFPLSLLFQIVLSVFPASSDASTHFHIEFPSLSDISSMLLWNLNENKVKYEDNIAKPLSHLKCYLHQSKQKKNVYPVDNVLTKSDG